MKTFARLALLLGVCLAYGGWVVDVARAEQTPWPALPPLPANGGTVVLGPDQFYGGVRRAEPDNGSIVEKTIGGQRALAFEVSTASEHAYAVEVNWRYPKPIATGEVLWVSMAVRATHGSAETGQGSLHMYGQLASPPWTAFGELRAATSPGWHRVEMAMTSDRDFAANEAHFSLQFAQEVQGVELADFQVRSFGVGADAAALPGYVVTYDGRDPAAPWRAEAEKRIDRLRKADLLVDVVDAAGHPVTGATVTVRQKSHAFRFGTCINESIIADPGPDGAKYREILTRYFNHAVVENGLKWSGWEGPWRADGSVVVEQQAAHRKVLCDAIDWMIGQGMTVRGHNLIWPAKQYVPPDVVKCVESKDVAGLKARIASRIADGAGAHWKPQAAPWSKDWKPRRNGQAYIDLVYGKWWTNATASTDASGRVVVRGFKGAYDVQVSIAGKTTDARAVIGRDGGSLKIVVSDK